HIWRCLLITVRILGFKGSIGIGPGGDIIEKLVFGSPGAQRTLWSANAVTTGGISRWQCKELVAGGNHRSKYFAVIGAAERDMWDEIAGGVCSGINRCIS